MAQKPALTGLQKRIIHMMKREEERAVRMPKQRECWEITLMETASGGSSARRAMLRFRSRRSIPTVTLTIMVLM